MMRLPTGLVLFTIMLVGCGSSEWADPSREFGPAVPANATQHAVTIHQPETLGVVDTRLRDIRGVPVGVACATCHGPDAEASWAEEMTAPEDIHDGVELKHGDLTCDYCHADDRTMLHRADGSELPMTEAMQLCQQCHGVQYRDYQAGSHGGMNGYWDLQRGPRDRNNCVDCHAPHTPAYERVMPVHPPRDRYLEEDVGNDHG